MRNEDKRNEYFNKLANKIIEKLKMKNPDEGILDRWVHILPNYIIVLLITGFSIAILLGAINYMYNTDDFQGKSYIFIFLYSASAINAFTYLDTFLKNRAIIYRQFKKSYYFFRYLSYLVYKNAYYSGCLAISIILPVIVIGYLLYKIIFKRSANQEKR